MSQATRSREARSIKYVEDHWDFDGRNRVLAITVGLSPLWLLVLLLLISPPRGGPMYEPTEAQLLGRQLAQLVGFAFAGVLMLAGTVVLWRARSERAAVGAILLLTLPALIVILFVPAFVIILLNATT